nr:hypothetical protein [Nitrosomonas nitrosa]
MHSKIWLLAASVPGWYGLGRTPATGGRGPNTIMHPGFPGTVAGGIVNVAVAAPRPSRKSQVAIESQWPVFAVRASCCARPPAAVAVVPTSAPTFANDWVLSLPV